MFTNITLFISAGFLQLVALIMMYIDPEPHGFGVLTLWLAPVLLIIGLMLPIIGLSRLPGWSACKRMWQENRLLCFGTSGVFLIALATYILTLEPTASLWDCSETIAAAYKLQVPHTPGTPLTLLLGRLFSMLALGDVQQVAWCINLMAAFFSALAVGITYLITWYFGQQLVKSKWVLFIGSIVGSLCLTFSDSFWFSAVEAETFGPSVFFMVLLIWLTIHGKRLEGSGRTRRIYLLSYLTGLGYCIHPMSILILPVCFLIWRSHGSNPSWKQLALSFGFGVVVILFVSKVIAVDLFEWAFQMDLLLVNQMSLPFYSGVVLLVLILSAASFVSWKQLERSRVMIVCVWLMLAGFSPYLMLFVRSAKLPPINEFSPSNLAKIKPFMNRESYPSRPLIYGPYFDARITDMNNKAHSYIKGDGGYQEVGEVPEYVYEKDRQTILPRIYSNDPKHVEIYRQWSGLNQDEEPRFSDNLNFLIYYQLGHMFGRYIFWNFAGRVSDVQHAGWLKPWHGIPDRTTISYNKAQNQYFMLPLLLGVLGMFFQLKRDRNGFLANLTFFLITGLLLTIYLNGTPNEPRERDYIYVGSYLAFCIWIGIGVMGVSAFLGNRKMIPLASILVLVPVWMAYQNWDDHDRSGRVFQTQYTRSILESCEEDAILYTGGDNDTFPLWYLQDVEGVRTDVRVKVLSYFNTGWYIDQLTRKYYESEPFKLTLREGDNQYGPYDPVYVQERTQSAVDWGKYMNALKSRNPKLRIQGADTELYFIPSRKINITTSKGSMVLTLNGSYLPKSEMAILDLIYSNEWKRPIYFNFTSINSLKIDLKPYVVQEGLVYRLTPNRHEGEIPMDLDRAYANLIANPDFSNLADSQVYFNYEDYIARMINPLRFAVNDLITEYAKFGDQSKVEELIQYAYGRLCFEHLEPSYADIQLSRLLSSSSDQEQSQQLLRRVNDYLSEKLRNQLRLGDVPAKNDLLVLQEAVSLLNDNEANRSYMELVKMCDSYKFML